MMPLLLQQEFLDRHTGVHSLEHSQCTAYDRLSLPVPGCARGSSADATPAGQPRSSTHSNQFEFVTTGYVALEPRRVRELDRHCIVRRTLRRIADREQSPT